MVRLREWLNAVLRQVAKPPDHKPPRNTAPSSTAAPFVHCEAAVCLLKPLHATTASEDDRTQDETGSRSAMLGATPHERWRTQDA